MYSKKELEEYNAGRNAAFDNLLIGNNPSEIFLKGYEEAKEQIKRDEKLEAFRKWYNEWKKN